MKNVLIATPSHDGKVDVWFANSLAETIKQGLVNDINFCPVYMSYDSLVQRARNDLISIAFKNNFDDILWIDSDIEWDPSWAIDAIKSEKDVIGLPVIKKSITEESYNVKCKPENLLINEDGLISVESVGTGFLKLSKKAYSYLWNKSNKYTHNNEEKRWVFEIKIQDNDIISEDVLMCQKLKKGGFEIFIDPEKTCSHVGALKYIGNFKAFIDKIKKEEE
jgi:hypothetical protein